MAPTFSATLGAALCVPAAAFVAPSATSQSSLTLRGSESIGAVAGAAPEGARSSSLGVTAGSVGACLAAAGALAVTRKRSTVSRPSMQKGQPVFVAGFEDVVCLPGSEKALGTMVGADVETGGEPWDPLGFGKLYDRNFDFNNVMIYPHVQWLREAELKHGRVCMLAFVGMVVQQWYQIPGLPQEPDWIKALDACYQDPVAQLGLVQISVFAMVVEGRFFPGDAWYGNMDREPGDLGFDPLKFAKRPSFDLKTKQLSELKNGRLAMIGVASMAANHIIPGSVPFLTGAYAERPNMDRDSSSSSFCGKTSSIGLSSTQMPSKTAARYTTQVILPALQWIKTGLKVNDLQATELKAKNLAGVDVLVGKDGSGKLFCVGNLCPHIGTPMSEGADVIGDIIVCPLHGSSFKVTTGELIDWCPSPPIIGPLTGLPVEKKNLAVFDVRSSFFGGDIEVLVDTNAKKAWEADYWKGVLDAQGKDDGTYY